MPVFLYHPTNEIGKRLREAYEEDGFQYKARPHMEAIIKDKLKNIGVDIEQGFYCHLGSMSGHSLFETINRNYDFNPEDNQLHKLVANHFKSKSPWAYVKLMNGPKMQCVVGYCNSDPTTPFLMSPATMAQEGIINSSFVPR